MSAYLKKEVCVTFVLAITMAALVTGVSWFLFGDKADRMPGGSMGAAALLVWIRTKDLRLQKLFTTLALAMGLIAHLAVCWVAYATLAQW